MPKRQRSSSTTSSKQIEPSAIHGKRRRIMKYFNPIKIATAEAAAAVDADPPFFRLQRRIQEGIPDPGKGRTIFYWMRMADLRISDNRALSEASKCARSNGIPLVTIFALSPQDYVAHDRSSRRIDFVLRNLRIVQNALHERHIPFHIIIHSPRKTLPDRIFELLEEYECNHLFANMEYEVDELRRDTRVWKLGEERGVQINFFHNKCIIEPGVIVTKQGRGYAVYSPYWRNWLDTLNRNLDTYIEEAAEPTPNPESIRQDEKFMDLFQTTTPEAVPGFVLDEEDAAKMQEYWPAGEVAAKQMLDRFLKTRARSSQLGGIDPLNPGAQDSDRHSRIQIYHQARDQMDKDTTSRLSVYLSSGVLSIRECVRQTLELTNAKRVDGNSSSGVGRWIQELAWRDFYTDILSHFPRVSMGRPYLEKYSEVVWEERQAPRTSALDREEYDDVDSEPLRRWKEGLTGVPIVDAAMRCLREMGWIHNRARMIVAMYLTKDLMIDWRVGERYFMQTLIDGDLASNNGGWQWSASTGVDPCPYFRIFNPHSQSPKADPTGDFIRYWVPELANVRGPDIHNPPDSLADKLNYPRKIIDHSEARVRALRRFKNPGTK